MTRFPIIIDEIWMRLTDTGSIEFCTEAEHFWWVELEADIWVVSHANWNITAVRLKASDSKGFQNGVYRSVDRYQELTGPLLDAAKAHLMATSSAWIQERIEEDHLPETSREDRKIDLAKHEMEGVA